MEVMLHRRLTSNDERGLARGKAFRGSLCPVACRKWPPVQSNSEINPLGPAGARTPLLDFNLVFNLVARYSDKYHVRAWRSFGVGVVLMVPE